MQRGNLTSPWTLLPFAEFPSEPVITVYNAQGEASDDKIPQLFKGNRFAFSCQTPTSSNVLSIRLKSGVNTEHPTEQIQFPSVGEAIFIFPAAEDAHQGTHQCDYNFNYNSEIFSKPATVSLTVKGKPH